MPSSQGDSRNISTPIRSPSGPTSTIMDTTMNSLSYEKSLCSEKAWSGPEPWGTEWKKRSTYRAGVVCQDSKKKTMDQPGPCHAKQTAPSYGDQMNGMVLEKEKDRIVHVL